MLGSKQAKSGDNSVEELEEETADKSEVVVESGEKADFE